MREYKVEDARAFLVVIEHHNITQVVGFATELYPDRWAACNAIVPDVLLGVFDTTKEAYDAIVAAEENK